MENKDLRFKTITMTGRLCYIFMCVERYLLAVYPDKDWTVVARKMWTWVAEGWSDGWWDYSSRTPDIILKYKSYDEIDDPSVTCTVPHDDFEKLSTLYNGISDGSEEDELVRVLNIPYDMGNTCDAFDYRDKVGEEQTIGAIHRIEEVLKSHGIELPTVPSDESLTIRDDVRNHNHIIDIWRMKVNADHLSIILNKGE